MKLGTQADLGVSEYKPLYERAVVVTRRWLRKRMGRDSNPGCP